MGGTPVLALDAAGQPHLAIVLGLLGAVALGGWFAVLALLAVATRPRTPDAGPAVLELVGEEPPAVAGFLANDWKVPSSAAAATLIDLAATGVFAIDEVGNGDYLVRL